LTCTVRELADRLGARLIGDGSVELSGIAGRHCAGARDLIFVEDPKHLAAALASQAGAVIVGLFAADAATGKALLICDQPRLAFARAAREFRDPYARVPGIHSTAVVDRSAQLGANVTVEPRAVVGAGASIGEGTTIGVGCVVGQGVMVGAHCTLHPNVTIYSGTSIGDRVVLHAGVVLGSDGFGYVRDKTTGRYEQFPQRGRLEIADDVDIGANTAIDRGALDVTRIGRGTKIDNLVHIGHNCLVGADVVIAAQTGISGSCTIEDGCIIGGQVGFGEGARITRGTILGGQSGVLPKKVLRGTGEVLWGTPARPLKQYLKELAELARLARKNNT
jgi:UDP-3-O-[3-hydroxymyristoyl] glucosamine N-acyltransferase